MLNLATFLVPWANVCVALAMSMLLIAFGFGRVVQQPTVTPVAPKVVEESKPQYWTVKPVVRVIDKQGLTAKIIPIVLSSEFNWKYASADEIEFHGNPVSMANFLASRGLQATFARCKRIIAVGNASQEGRTLSPNTELSRARMRAEFLLNLLRQYAPATPTLHTLSLGFYNGEAQTNTTIQRSVLLLGVIEEQSGINLAEAISQSVNTEMGMTYDFNQYATFEMRRFR